MMRIAQFPQDIVESLEFLGLHRCNVFAGLFILYGV